MQKIRFFREKERFGEAKSDFSGKKVFFRGRKRIMTNIKGRSSKCQMCV